GENGCLTEVENTPACPFNIKRVYYLYDVPADSSRGGHAHHQMESLIVAASGSFDVTIDNGHERRRITLNRPFQALHLRKGIWRELDNFSSGAICLVIASEKYDEADYIRDRAEFLRQYGLQPVCLRVSTPRYPFLDLAVDNAPYAQALKEAAARVIDSGYYIGGPEVEAVEADIAKITQTSHAIGVSNGLDGLRLILRAWLEMGRLAPGDEVIVPADTYIASVLAITDNGLRPVFVDADLDTYNINVGLIERAITPRTRAIMVVHLYGRACWSPALADIAKRHELLIIEDNAQAIGARALCPGLYGTRATGGLGHAGAFSFYPTKNIGALGDAGAVTTNDAELAAVVRSLRNYGTDRPYHNVYAGLNCRLDPIQAAMLRVKLPHVDEENARRRLLAETYDREITNPLVVKPALPQSESGAPEDAARSHVWHQYVVRVADRDAFRKYLLDKGVETGVHYPVMPSRQSCYSQYAHIPLPAAEQIAREVVSLPIGRSTSADDARAIARIINGYSNKAE
ncbi:MAG: DegT/DnrJ/EryC1/StrS family aminotransferase, partial [Muribaculaceae bacterium]|nr:DegT/DnrJ/EryC1/StrS family aminotransferase [Muribaculaceae bacterium]